MPNEIPMWEQQPGETDTAYAAFKIYRDLPAIGENKRSMANVQSIVKHKTVRTIADWSSKYSWVERVRVYDATRDNSMMTVREASLEAFQQQVAESLSSQMAVIDQIFNRQLLAVREMSEAGEHLKATELNALMNALTKKDDLLRRLANMPTDFISVKVDDAEANQQRTFVIGGDR
jgi:hypothetical protein